MVWISLLLLVVIVPLSFHLFATLFIGRALKADIDNALKQYPDIAITQKRWLTLTPNNTQIRAGLVFQPGGYVDAEAYLPMLARLAQQGIFCVIVCGPSRLSILDRFAADNVIATSPEIAQWFLAGHSLGGAVTNLYIRDRYKELCEKNVTIKGLIFLGCYFSDRHSLANLPIPTLSVYGSEDGFAERFEPNHHNLPTNTTIVKIDGGNHGQFGYYGRHLHDNPASISRAEQLAITQHAMTTFISRQLDTVEPQRKLIKSSQNTLMDAIS
jgi:hypothetical protein